LATIKLVESSIAMRIAFSIGVFEKSLKTSGNLTPPFPIVPPKSVAFPLTLSVERIC
jgi:hypothetical protein